jgi:LysM repeat protein
MVPNMMDYWFARDKLLKHGTTAILKIKSHAKRITGVIVLITLFLTPLACSRSYVNGTELTQTALAYTPIVITSVPSDTPDPTASVTDTATAMASPTVLTLQDTLTDTPPAVEPTANATIPISDTPTATSIPPIIYYSQAGDTLPALAVRFGVLPQEVIAMSPIPNHGLIQPKTLLVIPNRLGETGPNQLAMPDSEVVYSPSAVGFDINAYVDQANGYLNTYKEYLDNGWYTGAMVVQRVATENSINPRLLLALLEYQSHWVTGQPKTIQDTNYPMGYVFNNEEGLYHQLSWAVSMLSLGYYQWRSGGLTELDFTDGQNVRIAPNLNSGTVAVQYLFSRLFDNPARWAGVLYGSDSFTSLYTTMFGDPWQRAETVEPLYPPSLTQPTLELPFPAGETWAFTGGPHPAWGPDGALAAVDIAPSSSESGCVESDDWVTAMAPGLVVRADNGAVMVDMDGDGHEQTGWDILYLHVATRDRVKVGTIVETNDHIGHPSCEGGEATGSHVHVARKYNGEWILADGPLPFVMSGWTVHAGNAPYIGTMTRAGQTITACSCGDHNSQITRPIETSTP